MSRDMKPRKPQPARKKSAGGTLIGMFIVVGLVFWRLYEVWRDEQ